jgi:hypothetical protein
MGLFFKNPLIPHPLRRKRGAESKRITETRRPIGFLSTQGLCGPRRSLAENVQRRLDVIATYSRFPIVGVSERDTAPFHEMILQVRPRRERGCVWGREMLKLRGVPDFEKSNLLVRLEHRVYAPWQAVAEGHDRPASV